MIAATAPETPKTLSVNGFAARMGVDRGAVRKAIVNGRLDRSVTRDAQGRPMIADIALAEQEWAANREHAKARGPGDGLATMSEDRKRLVRAQTRKLSMANRKQAGTLVPARAMEIRYSTMVVTAKTKIRGVPSRVKQRIPHLTVEELAIIAELLDEALEELANGA